jgi:uncharacterized OsmC-like protein
METEQTATHSPRELNGFDLRALGDIVEQVTSDPSLAIASFRVHSEWKGGARVEAQVEEYELGGQRIARQHVIRSDEPTELFGTDSAPNPQELLFAALNACMIFGYASTAAAMGIQIERVSIETRGALDVRGALGVADVPPGMQTIHYDVRIRANASEEQLRELHAAVTTRSPNRYHIATAIQLEPRLVIE